MNNISIKDIQHILPELNQDIKNKPIEIIQFQSRTNESKQQFIDSVFVTQPVFINEESNKC